MTIGTRLYTMLNGELVGTDSRGNRYYRGRRRPSRGREKRWVIYEGDAEASRVPPAWHAWLHHTTDAAPDEKAAKWDWQRDHVPNRTGTAEAYHPPGSLLTPEKRPRATGDYEPWQPS